MKEDKKVSYISMFLGGMGTILVLLGAINLFDNSGDLSSFYLVFFGFLFTINYINYLESKAGVSKKATWSRAILSILIFLIVSYFMYF
ncbi:hypothetical protein RGU12_19480 [Fredinandcohnia sp. QZ13]|uniref:hypothetical protein n=1 Tax=Fredinandcohnia sp. QZ13 TaxID=3073144 RepID=UPI002853548B|nr:hypothetical protein [Fredinandcohnia sp. QZ13]MDR4889679.1 hypothetical protein [Fredinandcohnia sp. QZ13]